MAPSTLEQWVALGSAAAGLGLLFLPDRVHDEVRYFITRWAPLVAAYFNPYVQVTFSEYGDDQFRRNKLFDSIGAYLSDTCTKAARKLKAEHGRDSSHPVFTLDDNLEVTDDYKGAHLWWSVSSSYKAPVRTRGNTISILPAESEPRRYRLKFHKRHRQLITTDYLPQIIERGNELIAQNRQRRLFTNHAGKGGVSNWCPVPFEHPATFETLAMDPGKKEKIINDLRAFQEGKEYYSKVGKAWKRGYLLYGPPGTGKSTMISAMANLLDYDVYDLDLTSVKNNADLRRLFVDTRGKSIIVIEDIDAIDVDRTSKRKANKQPDDHCMNGADEDQDVDCAKADKDDNNKVTLSGLLSFADGLWSACGGQRIIVFTTNHKDRLDEALIRRGRMDEHIELTYCRFEAFKVLANNYLGITDHSLFGEIKLLLDENDMSPADVAHNLMPKGYKKRKRDIADEYLEGLVSILKKSKNKASVCTIENTRQKVAAEMNPTLKLKEATNMCQHILED